MWIAALLGLALSGPALPPSNDADLWELALVVEEGAAVPDLGGRPTPASVARVLDFAVLNTGPYRALILDGAGQRVVLRGVVGGQQHAEAPLAGWVPVGVDLGLDGDDLTLVHAVGDPGARAVLLDEVVLAQVGAVLHGGGSELVWEAIDAASVTDDGAALVTGSLRPARGGVARPTLALLSTTTSPPSLLARYEAGLAPLSAAPAAPGLWMNDLGHAIWIGTFGSARALMVDEVARVRSGAPGPWPNTTYELAAGDAVALNHQLEWAACTTFVGPGAKRRALVRGDAAYLLQGALVDFASGPAAVRLSSTAPLFLSDNSTLMWTGLSGGSTALFVDRACVVETGASMLGTRPLMAIDLSAKAQEASYDGRLVLFLGELGGAAPRRALLAARPAEPR